MYYLEEHPYGGVGIALALAAFGAWRLAVGLHYLGVIKRRIPDNYTARFLPKFMQAPKCTQGLVDLFGGGFCIIAAFVIALEAILR